ncbi:hypothetical protein TIFTF001_022649 [Ficus carica]|uniref:Uncharacterized protein n=1 Tax=Ficus carica TaxID=3494 RepID=A0AA88AI60_FICCA|nr:hypothetical protein TIFTF001_022649 [Ficus carica]
MFNTLPSCLQILTHRNRKISFPCRASIKLTEVPIFIFGENKELATEKQQTIYIVTEFGLTLTSPMQCDYLFNYATESGLPPDLNASKQENPSSHELASEKQQSMY